MLLRSDRKGSGLTLTLIQVTDDEGTAWTEFVHEGDQVKAIVIDINLETKKISLGLKASLFPQGASDDEDEDEDEDHSDGSDDGELDGDEELEDGSDDGQDIEFDDGESAEDSDGEMEVDESEVGLPQRPFEYSKYLLLISTGSCGFNQQASFCVSTISRRLWIRLGWSGRGDTGSSRTGVRFR